MPNTPSKHLPKDFKGKKHLLKAKQTSNAYVIPSTITLKGLLKISVMRHGRLRKIGTR